MIVDEKGREKKSLDILSIAAKASMHLETLLIGDDDTFSGITINNIQRTDGKAGSSKELAVPISGKPLRAAHSGQMDIIQGLRAFLWMLSRKS